MSKGKGLKRDLHVVYVCLKAISLLNCLNAISLLYCINICRYNTIRATRKRVLYNMCRPTRVQIKLHILIGSVALVFFRQSTGGFHYIE